MTAQASPLLPIGRVGDCGVDTRSSVSNATSGLLPGHHAEVVRNSLQKISNGGEPRLFGMEAKVELAHARREVFKKPFRIVLMLEADNRVVRIADDDHVARRLALSPLTDPEIVDVVQVDVCEERRNYRALRRPLHRFDLSALLKHPCRQPFADQPDNPPITDPMLNEPYQPCVADRVEGSGRRLPIAMTFRRP